MTFLSTTYVTALVIASGLLLTGCGPTAQAPTANETAPVSPTTAPPAQVPAASNGDTSGAITGAQANGDTPPVRKK